MNEEIERLNGQIKKLKLFISEHKMHWYNLSQYNPVSDNFGYPARDVVKASEHQLDSLLVSKLYLLGIGI